jgi:hypothetical protein
MASELDTALAAWTAWEASLRELIGGLDTPSASDAALERAYEHSLQSSEAAIASLGPWLSDADTATRAEIERRIAACACLVQVAQRSVGSQLASTTTSLEKARGTQRTLDALGAPHDAGASCDYSG